MLERQFVPLDAGLTLTFAVGGRGSRSSGFATFATFAVRGFLGGCFLRGSFRSGALLAVGDREGCLAVLVFAVVTDLEEAFGDGAGGGAVTVSGCWRSSIRMRILR